MAGSEAPRGSRFQVVLVCEHQAQAPSIRRPLLGCLLLMTLCHEPILSRLGTHESPVFGGPALPIIVIIGPPTNTNC